MDEPLACALGEAFEPTGALMSGIEKLALEVRDAVRRRDWPAARRAAGERAALQEARHRTVARRWS